MAADACVRACLQVPLDQRARLRPEAVAARRGAALAAATQARLAKLKAAVAAQEEALRRAKKAVGAAAAKAAQLG